MRTLTLAATQMTCGWDWEANLSKAESLVRNAAQQGRRSSSFRSCLRDRTFAKTRNLSISSGLIHWQTTLPFSLVASNRIGTEEGDSCSLTFYGSSFIAGPLGELRQQAGSREEAVLVETFDLDEIQTMRQGWGLFRDRRPDLYGSLLSLDGSD